MALLNVLTLPDPRLRQMSCPVINIQDEHIQSLLDDMWDTMYEEGGIGLAANQVGVLLRILVMDVPIKDDSEESLVFEMINPQIIWRSEEVMYFEEGCLSVPGFSAQVQRSCEVRVSFWDGEGVQQTVHLQGLPAICLQHEMDHLNGVVFLDYLEPRVQEEVLTKLRENTLLALQGI
jgi:peptide deformylase